ncbi:hypothetical protein SCHPADRAFT_996001 [Schizopora paradoxa]|uniref:Uncharacterized protein n=1 Tax=Schizopora paradoxa TaxID=27342 RepID=A0A0H2RUL4_9AGAM|nr:hypothetical protein SCHPADRAFT_996001 [Schizopora paradoxa]
MPTTTTTTDADRLTEEQVADAFHSYLKSSLAQAKAEKLLDTELLSSAEADIMITGPALCLYFAALRSTTTPPSVPLPQTSKSAIQHDLSPDNCPLPFVAFLKIWSRNVTPIQLLIPEHQHDLARIICGLEPLSQPINPSLNRIAAELRAVAIEISQRRTFQDRYAADLQAAIDAGEGGSVSEGADQGTSSSGGSDAGHRRRVKASFVPPPMYEPSPTPSPNRSPGSTTISLPPTEPLSPHSRQYRDSKHLPVPPTPSSPYASSATGPPSSSTPSTWSRSRTPSPAPPSPSSSHSRESSSSSFVVDAPAMQLIRETLYASLGEVFATHPYLRRLLQRDPPRAYFASVGLAILDVSTSRTSIDPIAESGTLDPPTSASHHHVRTLSSSSEYSLHSERALAHASMLDGGEPSVTGILGAKLTLRQTPPELRPFMRELCDIGRAVREMEEEDSARAVEIFQDGGTELPEPTMERVKRMLERGIAAEGVRVQDGDLEDDLVGMAGADSDRRSIEGRAITLANRINGLSLSMTKLRAFKERQSEVFKVLASVRS